MHNFLLAEEVSMKRIYEFSSKTELLEKLDYDNVSVVSEYNYMTNYLPVSVYNLEYEIRNSIESYISNLTKDKFFIKTIYVVDYDCVEKVFIYVSGITEDVLDKLNEKYESILKTKVLLAKNISNVTTSFKEDCISWANEIQRYLTNCLNFKGVTKINALKTNRVEVFDIAICGKGTTDKLVDAAKKIAIYILVSDLVSCSTDEKIKTIEKFFEIC
jgi:hypothetical protein